MPLGYWLVSSWQRTVRPVLVVVAEISSTITHAIADERLGAPVLADEGEEPVLDFVPLACTRGGQVADHDVEAELVGQLPEFAFPQPHPRAVAAAAISGDQQSRCIGVARPPEVAPPLTDAIDRESSRVMIDADTSPTRNSRPGHRPRKALPGQVP